jgi:hypothetical protein
MRGLEIIKMEKEEAALKEYEALRNEILAYISREDKRLGLIWAGIGVLFGAAIYSKLSELSFLSFFLCLLGWWSNLGIRAAIRRIASYIEVCLEKKIIGLNWETVLHSVDDTYERAEWPIYKKLIDSIFSFYGLSSLICAIGVIVMTLADTTYNCYQFKLRVVLAVIALCFWIATIFRDFRRLSQATKWRDIFREFINEKQSDN